MDYISTQKFIRLSPTKVRPVVFIIKKLRPVEAVKMLPFMGKSAGEPLGKVIKTAMANARVAGVADTDLVFKEIQIGEGPRLKRGRAGSRGRLKPYVKRMSHIRVVLAIKSEMEKEAKPKSKKVRTKVKVETAREVKKTVENPETKKKGVKKI